MMRNLKSTALFPLLLVSAILFGGFSGINSALAAPFFITGDANNSMAMASRPSSSGKIEIEAADDFVLTSPFAITSATFTGLVTGTSSTILNVDVEIYRVFPNDSNVGRTSGAPTFSTPNVPTRVNSPSDDAFATRDSSVGTLSFTTSTLSSSFTALNSVLNGINPKPGQATLGEGPVTGREVLFTANFTTPFNLPADHYFFVPQVQVSGDDQFYWLSGPRPIVAPGTPFPAGFTDLQAWIRNANLDPDWLRVGTDIVGGATPPTFNGAFSLTGTPVPEPGLILLVGAGLIGIAGMRKRVVSAR